MPSEVNLPESIEACHALLRQKDEVIETLAAENKSLREDFEQLKRYIYGQRSERHTDDSQLTLFKQEQGATTEQTDEANDLEEEFTYRRRK